MAPQPNWFSSLLPGTKAPGEASGRVGLALVALALIILFSLLNASFFRLENFVVIGVNSTSILIAVLGTSALLIAGYVDLSIGSMMALIGIIVAKVAVATQDPAARGERRAATRSAAWFGEWHACTKA